MRDGGASDKTQLTLDLFNPSFPQNLIELLINFLSSFIVYYIFSFKVPLFG